jgi:hypothetical protein
MGKKLKHPAVITDPVNVFLSLGNGGNCRSKTCFFPLWKNLSDSRFQAKTTSFFIKP